MSADRMDRMDQPCVHVLSATRHTASEFWRASALGQSLQAHGTRGTHGTVRAHVRYANSLGLPDVYNHGIDTLEAHAILVFVHDDVWLEAHDGVDWEMQLRAALQSFDVVGVAGNTRLQPQQPAWCFTLEGDKAQWDFPHLSGQVGHGQQAQRQKDVFGPTPQACKVLDGLFLAARAGTLQEHGVRFDPLFGFHFYDLDFCRSATAKGLKLGTWPIDLTHQASGAGYGSPDWIEAYKRYLHKWR